VKTGNAGSFKPGDVRINRRGRPKKGTAVSEILSLKLDEKDENGILRREIIAEKLLTLAESGDIHALKYVIDRMEGTPRQAVELTTEKNEDIPKNYLERKKMEEELERRLNLTVKAVK
jgi:hypothetical protein